MKKFLSIVLSFGLIVINLPTFKTTALANTESSTLKFSFSSEQISDGVNVVFENGSAPLYSSEKGYGFVAQTSAMPSRTVDLSRIRSTDEGFVIEENYNTTSYVNSNNYNYGGLVFRVDLQDAGAYALKVVTTSTKSNTAVAPNGMQASRITGTGAWDAAGLVPNNNPARWLDDYTWVYNYVTGRKFIEFEIEPANRPASGSSVTVGVKRIEITKLSNTPAGDKPTIFVLGDSTQKTYTFEEAGMSGWGQIIARMFDLNKVNVINYSMGGRSLKSSHDEGRFNAVLMDGKEGDYVFIHSAHNDESTGNDNGPEARFGRGSNATTYPKWLNEVYIPALKARGMIPVLVTAMPRTNAGKYSENDQKPNGFNPDSVGFMRQAAASDPDVELIELYENAKAYIDKIGPEETTYIYMSLEAGESPGKTNSGSYANGHPDNKIDGTHYKEAASKQWCRIIADQICKQVAAGTASEKMVALKSYLRQEVQEASAKNDWSAVFPEMAEDVSETGNTNAYYRNQIEKLLELGVLFKDSKGNFYPKNPMKINDFISALCSLWKIDVSHFEKYYSSCDLTREVMAAIIYDAYLLKFGKDQNGKWIKPDYMTKYNGSTITPDDPNYDPNLTGKEAQYYPLVGWGALTDTKSISLEYAEKFYEVYNLGLMRSETGIARGIMKNGTELQPKLVVTREKAAKELWFLWVLAQTDVKAENQVLTVPVGSGRETITYQPINYTPPAYEFSSVNIDKQNGNKLSVTLKYNGTDTPSNKLVVELYDTDGTTKLSTNKYDVSGSGEVKGLDLAMNVGQKVVMYVVKSDSDTTKLSNDREVICTQLVVPVRAYTVTTAAGIRNGTLELTNLGQSQVTMMSAEVGLMASDDTVWWKASKNVTSGEELMPGLTPTYGVDGSTITLSYTSGNVTVNNVSFTGRVASTENGKFMYNATTGAYTTGSGLKFVAPDDGIWSVYVYNLGNTKTFAIFGTDATSQTDYLVATEPGASGNKVLTVPVEKGKTYYATVLGSKGAFLGSSFTPGAPVVSIQALPGDTIKITATPKAGFHVKSISAVDADNNNLPIAFNGDKTEGTFVMPEANVTINAVFSDEAIISKPYSIAAAAYDSQGKLRVTLQYNGSGAAPAAKLLIASYDKTNGKLCELETINVSGSGEVSNITYSKTANRVVKIYVWDSYKGMIPLSNVIELKK